MYPIIKALIWLISVKLGGIKEKVFLGVILNIFFKSWAILFEFITILTKESLYSDIGPEKEISFLTYPL